VGKFPNHHTWDQFFTRDMFHAYHCEGYYAAQLAVEKLGLQDPSSPLHPEYLTVNMTDKEDSNEKSFLLA